MRQTIFVCTMLAAVILINNSTRMLSQEKHPSHEKTGVSQNASPKETIFKARAMLDDAKKSLAQDGLYNCCIKDPCDRCALDHQSCPCAEEIKAGKSVCSDCYAGWQRGDGTVPGIKASRVKASVHSHKH
jgi:hypothetical protein